MLILLKKQRHKKNLNHWKIQLKINNKAIKLWKNPLLIKETNKQVKSKKQHNTSQEILTIIVEEIIKREEDITTIIIKIQDLIKTIINLSRSNIISLEMTIIKIKSLLIKRITNQKRQEIIVITTATLVFNQPLKNFKKSNL